MADEHIAQTPPPRETHVPAENPTQVLDRTAEPRKTELDRASEGLVGGLAATVTTVGRHITPEPNVEATSSASWTHRTVHSRQPGGGGRQHSDDSVIRHECEEPTQGRGEEEEPSPGALWIRDNERRRAPSNRSRAFRAPRVGHEPSPDTSHLTSETERTAAGRQHACDGLIGAH